MQSLDETIITVVSGLPRSGTSLMMSLLEAGGMPLLVDNIRQADEDNPKGYFEYELVKKLKDDQSCLLTKWQWGGVAIITDILSEVTYAAKHIVTGFFALMIFDQLREIEAVVTML